jgi:hypothetical protein
VTWRRRPSGISPSFSCTLCNELLSEELLLLLPGEGFTKIA